MNKLKIKKIDSLFNDVVCELTKEMDSHLIKPNSLWNTYLFLDGDFIKQGVIPIRFPGETVGAIEIDESYRIVKINIYSQDYYKSSVKVAVDRFIGHQIVFTEDCDE